MTNILPFRSFKFDKKKLAQQPAAPPPAQPREILSKPLKLEDGHYWMECANCPARFEISKQDVAYFCKNTGVKPHQIRGSYFCTPCAKLLKIGS